jgi:hypothetical protein
VEHPLQFPDVEDLLRILIPKLRLWVGGARNPKHGLYVAQHDFLRFEHVLDQLLENCLVDDFLIIVLRYFGAPCVFFVKVGYLFVELLLSFGGEVLEILVDFYGHKLGNY